jgi:hypothetical protein
VDELPEGAPSDYPWLVEGVLYVGPAAIATEAEQVLFRGGTTLVGLTDDRRSAWWLLVGDELTPLLDEETAYVVPVLSADGGTVAWRSDLASTEVDELTQHLVWEVVAYDVPTRTVLGRTRLEGDVFCCDQGGMVFVAGVANDGRVTLSGGPAGDLSTWRPGDPLVPVQAATVGYVGADSWPLGVSYARPQDSGGVRFARVDETGDVMEIGRVPQTGLWSADGRRFAQLVSSGSGATSRLEVREPVRGETVELRLPAARDWVVLAWVVETLVLGSRVRAPDAGDPTYFSVVRCDALTGACERVPVPSDGGA